MLPAEDVRYLADKGYDYSCEPGGSGLLLVIKNFVLPTGYVPQQSDLLLDVPSGYPDAGLDMFWMHPQVRLARTNAHPQAASVFEQKLGKSWQRFSRHGYPWRPGDSIASYMTWIRRSLESDVRAVAA